MGQRLLHRLRDRGRVGIRREPVDRGVDRVERLVGLEEEVAGEPEVGDLAVDDVEIDHDELAARNLELSHAW